MRHLLLFFAILTALLHAEEFEELTLSAPEAIASLNCDVDSLVGGLVSPLSGMPILRVTDLVAKGAQEIALTRTYLSPYMPVQFTQEKEHQGEYEKKHLQTYLAKNYKGWQYLPHLMLEYFPRQRQIRVAEPSGMTLAFQLTTAGPVLLAQHAVANSSGETPSGKYDVRNTRITYDNDRIIVQSTDGTERHYKQRRALKERVIYFLEKEVLKSGKLLKYYVDSPALIRIESQDRQERYTYATLTIDSTQGNRDVRFIASSGGQALYHYTQGYLDWHIKGKSKKDKFEENSNGPTPLLLASVSSPFFASESLSYCGRFLLANYTGQELQCGLHHDGFGQERHYRVDKLFFPGEQDAIYTLDYQPVVAGQKSGKTTVKRLDGTSTVYHFSKNLLVSRVQSYDHQTLKRDKQLTWTENNWLESIEMRDGEGHLLYRRAFEYDAFGNPIREHFTGDQETVSTFRTFTEDGRNLLLSKAEEGGKTTVYSYVPGTHLLSSKLVKDQDRILQSTVHHYDDAYNLIETIEEDKVTQYILRQEQPYLHMPEWIIESYKQDGVLQLLKKRHLTYDSAGNITEEEIYGADGQHAYTLYRTYNERGDILTETNALGDTATYTYDARGRLISETNFSGRLKKEAHYDLRGCLLTLQENERHTGFTYDAYDRCLSKTDPFGQTTHYEYDSAQIVRTTLAERTTRASYDALGCKLTEQDANGHVTQYKYNAYGSPIEIVYPDGGKETFLYTKNGWLASHTTLDGITIHYERDVLGRVLSRILKKTYGDSAEERFTYDALNLLSEKDREGNTKYYFYDGAGRKIREEFCGRTTQYTYDVLGQLATIKTDGLVTLYTRDLAGRICEECKTDATGNLLYKIGYAYDKDNNCTAIQRNEAVQTLSFDPFGRCIEEKDAFGTKTTTLYDEEQKSLRVVTADPFSTTTVKTYDIFSQLVKTEKRDRAGAVLSSQEKQYDAQGNLLCQQEHVHQNGQYQHTQSIEYTYTPLHQVQSCTRNSQRTTRYTYLPSGKIQSKTLPDGITLHYAYDSLGFLSRIDSSDDVIHHTFTHDRLGHLTSAYDENQDLLITKRLDPFGNVLSESFPSGLHIEKTYDAHNRLTSLTLPGGYVEYTYDPLYLRAVTRTGPAGAYTHTYDSYDQSGHLLEETLPGDLGNVIHTTNAKGFEINHKGPHFSQHYHHDACDNLIGIIGDNIGWRYTYDALSQLTSENAVYTYTYDSLFNRTHKNSIASPLNTLNELHAHDVNGCQTSLNNYTLTYDPLQRLTTATCSTKQLHFTYDPLGRRLSKTIVTEGTSQTEHYLYHGNYEIGAFTPEHSCKNLRILAGDRTFAIELPGRTLIPLCDVQNNIRRLIDLKSHSLADSYDFSAFGEELQTATHVANPWRFASKRLDPDLHLLDFGARLYDPHTGRWLTPDPAGFHDSANLYQYVFNNPFKYTDPHGQFILEMSLIALTWKVVAAACVAAFVGYQLDQANHAHHSAAINEFNAIVHRAVQNSTGIVGYLLTRNPAINKNIDVYAPDRPLPRDENTKEPIPDADVPHTQLGTKQGSKGPYPQAREFDKDGNPIRDIDFTDHGRPLNHPLPHQHEWQPNETGGTPKRSKDAQPLPQWNYK